jgi:Ulp1 family protease
MLDGDEDHTPIADKVMTYICSEYKGRANRRFSTSMKSRDLKVPQVPQQKNGSDCGLFVLEYFEQFLKVRKEPKKIKFESNDAYVRHCNKARASTTSTLKGGSQPRLSRERGNL